MIFALGFYLKRKKLAYSIFGVMLFAYLTGVGINVYSEMNGNPRIDALSIAQENGRDGRERSPARFRSFCFVERHYDSHFQWLRELYA